MNKEWWTGRFSVREKKYILKKIIYHHVPKAISRRRKKGGEWKRAQCFINAQVRWCQFGDPMPHALKEGCDLFQHEFQGELAVENFVPEKLYKLPCHHVTIVGNRTFYHSVAVIQIGQDKTKFSNWFFFQYGEIPCVIGGFNIPKDSNVSIVTNDPKIAEFNAGSIICYTKEQAAKKFIQTWKFGNPDKSAAKLSEKEYE